MWNRLLLPPNRPKFRPIPPQTWRLMRIVWNNHSNSDNITTEEITTGKTSTSTIRLPLTFSWEEGRWKRGRLLSQFCVLYSHIIPSLFSSDHGMDKGAQRGATREQSEAGRVCQRNMQCEKSPWEGGRTKSMRDGHTGSLALVHYFLAWHEISNTASQWMWWGSGQWKRAIDIPE